MQRLNKQHFRPYVDQEGGINGYSSLTRKQRRILFSLRSNHAGYGTYKAEIYGESLLCANCVDVEEDLKHIVFNCPSYNGYCSNILGFFVKKNVAPSMQLVLGGFNSVPENVEIACILVQFFNDIGRALNV